MHHTSTGKAILAHLPDEKVEAIIKSAGLPPATKNTITSAPVLMKELARVRAQGYAIDDQETGIGMRGIAAPVFDHNAKLVGSVGVGGPVFEMDGNLKSLIASVKECAREVSAKLGYHESTVMETYQSA
jgi:DNA-binding IclR family transcriptional regulator